MCQAHGTRCYSDSNAKLTKLNAKLASAQGELSHAKKDLRIAGRNPDLNFNQYTKLRKKITVLKAKAAKLQEQANHAQRDVDGTRTGIKNLERLALEAKTKKEIDALDIRRRTAASQRSVYEHQHEQYKSGYNSAISFAN